MTRILALQAIDEPKGTVTPAYSAWSLFGCASSVSASLCLHPQG